MRERFDALTSWFDDEQWRMLGVLACEQRVTSSMLQQLDLTRDAQSWLNDCVRTGLLLDTGVVHGLAYTRSITGERAASIAQSYRPLVLRRLAKDGVLEQVKLDARKSVGRGAVAGFMTALYSGDLQALRHELAELGRCSLRGEEEMLARDRLWEAVCLPFEPDTLTRIWGSNTLLVAEQVLLDASVTLERVDEVYAWVLSGAVSSSEPRTLRILAEHALLRGDVKTLGELRLRWPADEVLPLRVAEVFLGGDIEQAQRLLDELAGVARGSKRTIPCPPSVTAVLAVLALSRRQPAGTSLAKRLLSRYAVPELPLIPGWPVANTQLALVRALRLVMRSLTQPQVERPRLSPHHVPAESPALQTFATALAVLVEDCDPTTRMAWTRRLVDDAARWSEGGFAWLARQARHLAQALSLERITEIESLLPHQAGDAVLALLVEREPEWRIAIRAVDRLLESADREEATLSRRVCWFLDMTSGELAKPALEEYRTGAGWTQARRVDLAALRAVKDRLPPEDSAVLRAIESVAHGRSMPEALEALCGHPRVFNGARGRLRVAVVRGSCRVETHRERDHIVVQVHPASPAEGVHVEVESETRVVVYRVNAAFARLVQTLPSGLRIPESHQDEAKALLVRLAEHVEIHSPELGACRAAAADSTPCIRISPEAGAWWVEVGVRPFGELGRFFPPGLGRSVVTMHADGELFDSERKFDQEIARYDALLAQCPTLLGATRSEIDAADAERDTLYSFSLDEEGLYALLMELRESGLSCHIEWKNSRAINARGKVSRATLHGSLRRVKGWYLVNGSISLDQASRIELADLIRMPFTKTGRFIRLPSGDFLEIERRIGRVLSALSLVAQLPPRGAAGELRVPEAALEPLRSLVECADGVQVDSLVQDWSAHIDATLASNPLVPAELCATLRPYQIDGYRWLYRYSQLGFGVCLADDMGLGKTVQVIALLLTRAAAGPALVVAPTSVCSNWIDELRRFAPSLRVAEYSGRTRTQLLDGLRVHAQEKPTQVLIVSYAILQQDATELGSIEWNTAVLDEAQFIKNPNSLRAKAAFQLAARQRLAMTGTPVENHLGDLWSVFHFLNPTLLGSLRHFQLSYLRPIERDHDADQQAVLKQLVQPFLLRRRKDDVLQELPPTTTVRHEVRLSEDEAMRYALLRRQIHEKLRTPHGKREHKLQILAEITRLRRFCCHPRLVFPDAPTESSKLLAFIELAEELRDNGHRALVFSQFVDFLQLLREQLDERGFRYVYLDGATPKEVRSARVRAFQTGETELFLISLKAGGFGLNLTAADYVIHLDPWWNPAVEAQATDRAHRIGQQRPVTVYRLVTRDSIEERIVELHQEKRAIAEALLDGGEGTRSLTGEELLALL
jgi:superfamily II DNA or RNA helicase